MEQLGQPQRLAAATTWPLAGAVRLNSINKNSPPSCPSPTDGHRRARHSATITSPGCGAAKGRSYRRSSVQVDLHAHVSFGHHHPPIANGTTNALPPLFPPSDNHRLCTTVSQYPTLPSLLLYPWRLHPICPQKHLAEFLSLMSNLRISNIDLFFTTSSRETERLESKKTSAPADQ